MLCYVVWIVEGYLVVVWSNNNIWVVVSCDYFSVSYCICCVGCVFWVNCSYISSGIWIGCCYNNILISVRDIGLVCNSVVCCSCVSVKGYGIGIRIIVLCCYCFIVNWYCGRCWILVIINCWFCIYKLCIVK